MELYKGDFHTLSWGLAVVTVLVAAPHMDCIHLQATFTCSRTFNCESHS